MKTGSAFSQQLVEADNKNWLPGDIIAEQYGLIIGQSIPAGKYDLFINLRDECGFHNRNIQLAFKKEREKEPRCYKLGEVLIN